MMCGRDPNGLSNASTCGAMRYGGSRWAQIGESPNHQFCGKARSPLENIFAELPAPPRLVVFNFLGLSTFHWLAEGKLPTGPATARPAVTEGNRLPLPDHHPDLRRKHQPSPLPRPGCKRP
jgi:hypothetical protein